VSVTFVGQPVLEEGLDLAGACDERGGAFGAFALRDVEREVGVCFEGCGCWGAGVLRRCCAASAGLDVCVVVLVRHNYVRYSGKIPGSRCRRRSPGVVLKSQPQQTKMDTSHQTPCTLEWF